jgi:phytoene synthase
MYALYVFMRRTDDIGDSADPVHERRLALDRWRSQLDDALAGRTNADLWWLALTDTVHRFNIPHERLYDVVNGVESDLVVDRYSTFADLYQYCYQVASAVGLACVRIWGAIDHRAELPAERCGIAFQLTNVLRDLVEDYQRGRLYLPQEDLIRFGVDESVLATRQSNPQFEAMMRFQIERARDYYRQSAELAHYLPASGRAVLSIMRGVYGGLLDKIADSPARVLEGRVSLSVSHKTACVLRALPIRYIGLSARGRWS